MKFDAQMMIIVLLAIVAIILLFRRTSCMENLICPSGNNMINGKCYYCAKKDTPINTPYYVYCAADSSLALTELPIPSPSKPISPSPSKPISPSPSKPISRPSPSKPISRPSPSKPISPSPSKPISPSPFKFVK